MLVCAMAITTVVCVRLLRHTFSAAEALLFLVFRIPRQVSRLTAGCVEQLQRLLTFCAPLQVSAWSC